jgi:transposase-like protein
MDNKRKNYTPEFKLKVVLESMQRDTTQEEVCKKFGIASSMIHRWKKEFQANAASTLRLRTIHDRIGGKNKGEEKNHAEASHNSHPERERAGRIASDHQTPSQ